MNRVAWTKKRILSGGEGEACSINSGSGLHQVEFAQRSSALRESEGVPPRARGRDGHQFILANSSYRPLLQPVYVLFC